MINIFIAKQLKVNGLKKLKKLRKLKKSKKTKRNKGIEEIKNEKLRKKLRLPTTELDSKF